MPICGSVNTHADTRAAQSGPHLPAQRETCGILAGYTPLIDSLVQERDEVAGIARDENRTCPLRAHRPGGQWIEQRHPFHIEPERGPVEPDARHIGRTTGRRQNIIEILDAIGTIRPRASNGNAVAITLHVGNVRIGRQREFLVESCTGVCPDLRIADRTDATAPTEHRNTNTQPVQRLPQFQANNPRTDHRHGFG